MQTFSIKYLQTEFNDRLKRSYIIINYLHSWNSRIVQHIQVHKHNINRSKNKSNKIISVKAFDKSSTSFYGKSPKKLGIEVSYLDIVIAHNILNAEELEAFPVESE
jgi:hypothetical protein